MTLLGKKVKQNGLLINLILYRLLCKSFPHMVFFVKLVLLFAMTCHNYENTSLFQVE